VTWIVEFSLLVCAADNQSPSVRVEPRRLVVDVGYPVEFRCYATGYPPPTLEWTRGGGGGRRIPVDAVVDDGLLRLRAAGVEDDGEYLCTAMNVAGSDQQTAILTVTAAHGQSASSRLIHFTLTLSSSSSQAPRFLHL